MYKEKPSKLFLKYALPQMIGLVLNSVYLIVDGVFIGNRLGRISMAAAAIAVPIVEVLIAISIMLSAGTGIIISRKMGKNDFDGANKTFNLSIWLTLAVSTAVSVFGNLFLQQIVKFLGATPETIAQTTEYTWYILTLSPFLIFSFLLSGLARNDNKPKLAMISLAVGAVSNIVLDYVFMYPLSMGIAGAALATAIGPIISVLILLPHFVLKKGKLFFSKNLSKLSEVKNIFVLGIPSFVMEFSIGIVTFIYNSFIIKNGFGEIGLAAYLTIGYLALIILTVFLGAAQGLQPIFSYLSGQKNEKKLRELQKTSAGIIFVVGVLLYVLAILVANGFVTIFTPNDVELIKFTQEKIAMYFWGFCFAGYNILMITYWQSNQKTTKALIFAVLRSVVLLPVFLFVLPMFFGNNAIWIAMSGTEVVVSVLSIIKLRKSV